MQKKNEMPKITSSLNEKKPSLQDQKISNIKKYGLTVRGRKEYLTYLTGNKVTRRQAVAAYCYDCQGYFEDGRTPCLDQLCPLWPWSQFRDKGVVKTIVITRANSASYGPIGKAPDRLDDPPIGITKMGAVS